MSDPILLGIGAGVIIGAIGIVFTIASGMKKSHTSASVPTPDQRVPQPMPADEPQTVFPAPPALVEVPAEEHPLTVFEPADAPAITADEPEVVQASSAADDVEEEPALPSEDAELAPETEQPEPESVAERAAKAPYASGLVAPVELWIGDTRIMVKDGTRTQLKFRSYADSLLSALKEAKDETDKGV